MVARPSPTLNSTSRWTVLRQSTIVSMILLQLQQRVYPELSVDAIAVRYHEPS